MLRPYESSGAGRSAGGWALVAVLVACSPPAEQTPASDDAGAVNADAGVATCRPERQRQDGGCCPAGAFWEYTSALCQPVGPRECAATIFDPAAPCLPLWCVRHLDANDEPCTAGSPGCRVSGDACSDDELAAGQGCPPGTWPSADGACLPAGLPGQGGVAVDPEFGLPPLGSPVGVPPLMKLPTHDKSTFCVTDGALHICDPASSGCAPDEMPDPDAAGACMPFGGGVNCPAGFAIDMFADFEVGLPLPCTADLSACATGKFPQVPDGVTALYVAEGAASGGDGSVVKPLSNLAAALATAKAGAFIALADGTYAGGLTVDKALTIQGRCLASVVVLSPKDGFALTVSGPAAGQGVVQLGGVQIRGAGGGIRVAGGLPLAARQLWLKEFAGRGVEVAGAGSKADLSQSIVINGKQATDTKEELPDAGVLARQGGRVSMSEVRVDKALYANLVSAGKGSLILGDRLQIMGGRANAAGAWGVGALVKGGEMILRSTRLSGNRDRGVVVHAAGKLDLTGVVVDYNLPSEATEQGGRGLSISEASHVVLRGVRVAGNREVGLIARGVDTHLDAVGLVVDGTRERESDKHLGGGVAIYEGATARLRDVRLSDNRALGLQVLGAGTVVDLERALIDATEATVATGLSGNGAGVEGGARLELRASRLHSNTWAGLYVTDPGSKLVGERLVVDETRFEAKTHTAGYGLLASGGAHVALTVSRFSANRHAAIAAVQPETRLYLYGVLADLTANMPMALQGLPPEQLKQSAGTAGQGVVIAQGAIGEVIACRAVGNHEGGVTVWASGAPSTHGTLVGTEVRHTRQNAREHAGFGVMVHGAPGLFELIASRVAHNVIANVYVRFAGGILRHTVLEDTVTGVFLEPTYKEGQPTTYVTKELADGLLSSYIEPLTIQRSLIQRQLRAGALLNRGSDDTSGWGNSVFVGPVDFEGSVLRAGQFGIAHQGGAQFNLKGSLIIGTGQNIAGDLGLVVPDAPSQVE